MIMLNDFFTDDSLNIFTDASMNSYGNSGCAGCCLVFGEMDKRFPLLNTQLNTRVIKKCTNNFAEIRAIADAVYMSIQYKNQFSTIRIISDSQISIYGIRDRMMNWKISKKKGEEFGHFVGSQGSIKNQDIFLEIMYTIVENNLSIEFLHQAGHTSFSNPDALIKSGEQFKKYNGIEDDLDIELLRSLAFFNNYVDRNTRDVLYTVDLLNYRSIYPFEYKVFEGYDRSTFAKLIHPESIFNRGEN